MNEPRTGFIVPGVFRLEKRDEINGIFSDQQNERQKS